MALRILPLSPLPTASFLNGRRNIIHNILLQFERKAVANRSSLSQSLQNDIAFLMNDWRAGYSIGPLDADVQDIPTLRVVTQAFNLTSAEYNRLDRLVDTAISSATPSPIPSPTPGPAPTPAERVARDAGKAVATGVAQGVGQIALVGVVAVGALAYFISRHNRSALASSLPFDERKLEDFEKKMAKVLAFGAKGVKGRRSRKPDCRKAYRLLVDHENWLSENTHWIDETDAAWHQHRLRIWDNRHNSRCLN